MKCPKCEYERQPSDDAPEWQCPNCKVAYVKAAQTQNRGVSTPVQSSSNPPLVRPSSSTATPEVSQKVSDLELNEKLWSAARGQKLVIYSIVLNFILRAIEQTKPLPVLVMYGLSIGVAVITLFGVVRICTGLEKSQGRKIVYMVLSCYPLVNLIALVYLSVKTSRMLRDAGVQVGLLGAKQ